MVERLKEYVSQLSSFLTCRRAEKPEDQRVSNWKEKLSGINVQFNLSVSRLQKGLAELDEMSWTKILNDEDLKEYLFILNEWRQLARLLLPTREEETIDLLVEDGYHGWGELYHSLAADLRVKLYINGKSEELSIAQTRNLRSHPQEELRKHSCEQLNNTWKNNSTVISSIMNRISGVRTKVAERRGGEKVLEESLRKNRINHQTLDCMWKVVSKSKQPFIQYLNKKAKVLGKSSLQAHNFWAPMNEEVKSMSYKEGVDFILTQFFKSGLELKTFSQQAIQRNWVEAENRTGKSAYAFCAGFPISGESRVFMTYGSHITDTLTLAHELGHAFHNHTLMSVSHLNREYPMVLAETASTYSEMIVLNAALEEAHTKEQKLFLLDEKLKRSVMNFMEIHTRFIFELKLYNKRKQGFVPEDELNNMMNEAIDEGYQGSIDELSIYSWASTPHFYMTKTPFYNFPYTFGYLLAMGIYAKGVEEGADFETSYIELLRDSGRMNVEDLVMKHLGEDITKEDFWEKGMRRCTKDVEDFIKISELTNHSR
ncbi:M3 family oligoendopeptidase [Halobacillus rhizosphaerae]|uniref:M3 family oligoendopeptidase n=1 Tax=Halobacillus rhizosphaerae TaxID=3064889 RepID=UPI00398B7242